MLTIADSENHLKCRLVFERRDVRCRFKIWFAGQFGGEITKPVVALHEIEPVVKLSSFLKGKHPLDAIAHMGEYPQVSLMHRVHHQCAVGIEHICFPMIPSCNVWLQAMQKRGVRKLLYLTDAMHEMLTSMFWIDHSF